MWLPERTRTCDHSINSLQLLDDRLSILGDKVGPILFQLPPDFAADAGRLGSFVTLLVDLHSNLRLGPIWVKSGTEIETGASFSLNLSANFAALSGESGLLFDCGLPGFDDGV